MRGPRFSSLVAASLAACLPLAQPADARDVTFFALSDTHYGLDLWANNEQANKNTIAVLNGLPGTPYPAAGWGNVATPRGVTVTGDLTDSGTSWDWTGKYLGFQVRDGYIVDYPVAGGTGVHLHYPVYDGYGNHDIGDKSDDSVLNGLVSRNKQRSTQVNVSSNGLHYSWDWDDVHFVNVNLYAGAAGTDARDSLAFLQADLAAKVGASGRPVVLLQHYGFDGLSANWWTAAERQAEYDAVKDYNVVAIFAGHWHPGQPTQVMWNGIPTFVPGTANSGKFFAVNIKDEQMLVAAYSGGQWSNSWVLDVSAPAPIPEPAAIALFGCGLAMLLGYAAWRRSGGR